MADYSTLKGCRIEQLTDVIRVTNPTEHFVTQDHPVGQFRTDNREVEPGDIFVAVKGNRVDGHRFVDKALADGAAAALISDKQLVGHTDNCIVVPDPLAALSRLAAAHVRSLDTRIIGLTGSVGKTTTKEILACLLAGNGLTRKSEGNRNSTIGLPMELLKLREGDVWMVAEMGMSFPGEIAELMQVANPELAMLIAIRAVHMANFDSIDQIAAAKGEMVDHLREGGMLIYNADDPLVRKQAARYEGQKLPYGLVHPSSVIRGRIDPFPDWQGTLFNVTDLDGREHELYLPLVGRFNALNAVAASAAAIAAGVPAHELRALLMDVRSATGRSNLHSVGADISIVDDTYNSNPDAVAQVLRCFAPLAPHHFRWIVLGDMLELGEQEQEIHAELGRQLAGYGFDRITLVGPLCEQAFKVLQELRPENLSFEHYPDTTTAVKNISTDCPDGARIWCKASRGIGLEHLCRHLLDALSE